MHMRCHSCNRLCESGAAEVGPLLRPPMAATGDGR